MAVGAVILMLASCSRDPKRYIVSGDKFYNRGKYKEAILLYRNSIKVDPKFGEGYYHLALAELKMEHYQNAVSPLRRAIELLPHESADWLDSNIQYAEIMLASVATMRAADQLPIIAEVQGIKDVVLAKNPNSFEGLRLLAELTLLDSSNLSQRGKSEEAAKKLEDAAVIYRKVLVIKPGDTKVMMSLGKTLVLAGRTDEAVQMYRQVTDKDKTLVAPYLDLYRVYVGQQRLADAEEILKRAIASHPADSSLQYQLAQFYFSTANSAEMNKVLSDLKGRVQEDPDTFLKLGDFYTRIGKTDDAIHIYQDGISSDVNRRLDYQKRIVGLLIAKGKRDEAYQKVEQILKDDPKDAAMRTTKANFLLSKGSIDPAIAEFQTVVSSMPDNYVAHAGLGRAFLSKNDLPKATQQFEAALAINKDYLPARLELGRIALLERNWDKALAVAQSVLRINPTDGNAQLMEASAYTHEGQFDKARERLEPLVKANPKRVDPLAELALLDTVEHRYKEAEELFRRAYDADPSNLRGLIGVVQVRVLMNNQAGAIQAVADELKKQPQRADLQRELADAELLGGRYDKAIQDYNSVAGKFQSEPREQADIYARIGQSAEQKGDFTLAVDSYRKANQLAPSNIFYIRRVGDLLERSGKPTEALAVFRKAMNIDPNNPALLNSTAWTISETGGNLDEALTLAQRARKQAPSYYDAADTMGWIYLRKGQSESAIEVFKEITKKAEANATYHYHYGMALAQKGDKLNALKECAAALKNNPSKSEEAEIKDLVQKLS
jgi:tetratricopeptide (TPR) repeat protein